MDVFVSCVLRDRLSCSASRQMLSPTIGGAMKDAAMKEAGMVVGEAIQHLSCFRVIVQ